MTGDDRFLEAAEKGTEYLREHLRIDDTGEDIIYWYHAIEIDEPNEKKILASEFGDDYDAIPAYEQIYALAGPAQIYRITGDPRIKDDIEKTITLFDKYFYDPEYGGYFSHLDPITFDRKSDSLGPQPGAQELELGRRPRPGLPDQHLAGDRRDKYADMLVAIADTIEQRFPDDEHSPFVQERFHEDWSHDETWGWQQNRAVVGHNLKIAWNLMRIHHARPQANVRGAGEEDQHDDAGGRQRPAARRLVRRRGARPRARPGGDTASPGTTARPGGSRSRRSSPT